MDAINSRAEGAPTLPKAGVQAKPERLALLMVRAKKPDSIEMDQMGRSISHPDLRLPGNLRQVLTHKRPTGKGSHKHDSGARRTKQFPELSMTLAIYPTLTGDSLHWKKPIPLTVEKDHVWHLAMRVNLYSDPSQRRLIEIAPLIARVAAFPARA